MEENVVKMDLNIIPWVATETLDIPMNRNSFIF